VDGEPSFVVVAGAPERASIDEHVFVLNALGIPYRVERAHGQLLLSVPEPHVERARAELAAYQHERRHAPPREALPPVPPGALPSAGVYAALLALVYVLADGQAFGLPWWERGVSDAARIFAGEPWRAATALTLHMDVPHLAGNLAFGALFGVLFAQLVGSGVAWSSGLLAGFLGNLINAWFQGSEHRSVGASTAVFGLWGCLIAYEWRRRGLYRAPLVRRVAPLVLGLCLFAWQHTAVEQNTDVGAHAFGMLSGGALGCLIGAGLSLRRAREPWPQDVQLAAGAASLFALAAAWLLALR
jgi:membrane associated rhomboid family serine protease